MTDGERVKQVREYLHMTQPQFAERLKLSYQAISKIENGRAGLSRKNAKMISQEYGISEKWLLTGEGDMIDTNADAMSAQLREIITAGSGDFRRNLINTLANLPPDHWKALEAIATQIAKKHPKE